jgi:hypothetical protein
MTWRRWVIAGALLCGCGSSDESGSPGSTGTGGSGGRAGTDAAAGTSGSSGSGGASGSDAGGRGGLEAGDARDGAFGGGDAFGGGGSLGAAGSGGTPAVHPYPTCAEGASTGGCKCARTSTDPTMGWEACLPMCARLNDPVMLACPRAPSGTAVPECALVWTMLTDEWWGGCILPCTDNGAECPTGMACGVGANGRRFCAW